MEAPSVAAMGAEMEVVAATEAGMEAVGVVADLAAAVPQPAALWQILRCGAPPKTPAHQADRTRRLPRTWSW